MYLFLCFLGQPQSFTVSVRPADNFPVDFYLLIDESFSMNDDLQNLKNLSSQLGVYVCVCAYMCMHTHTHTCAYICDCMYMYAYLVLNTLFC